MHRKVLLVSVGQWGRPDAKGGMKQIRIVHGTGSTVPGREARRTSTDD